MLGLLCTLACGSPESAAPSPAAQAKNEASKASGSAKAVPGKPLAVLRVGTSGDYAPFSKGGEGFDIDVATRMAKDLGTRVQWVPFRWPELTSRLRAGAFDIAMSGITWRPARAVHGHMSRAIARGGPCLLRAESDGPRLAVNRGGILETWTRQTYPDATIRTVDNNLRLPDLLAGGEVDAIVTDRFERQHFQRKGWRAICMPPRDRKVYWISPARAADLGPRVDAWLAAHETELGELRQRWFSEDRGWTQIDHLVDLLARRLAMMPAVGAYKRARDLPIEDAAREARVLAASADAARAAGLDPQSVEALFRLQIDYAKRVQLREQSESKLDLEHQLRPTLIALGARLTQSLAASQGALPELDCKQLKPLMEWLKPDELPALCDALRQVRPANP